VRLAVEDAEVEGEKPEHESGEAGVQPPRVGEGKEQFQWIPRAVSVSPSACIDK